MSKSAPIELLSILAAARVSLGEYRDFLEYVKESPNYKLDDDFKGIQKAMRIAISDHNSIRNRPDLAIDSDASRAEKEVQNILKSSSITLSDGAKLINDFIIQIGAARPEKIIHFNAKDGFSRWFRRTYNVVGGSNILRATILATGSANSLKSDWSLKR